MNKLQVIAQLILVIVLLSAVCECSWNKEIKVSKGKTRVVTYSVSPKDKLELQFLTPNYEINYRLDYIALPLNIPLRYQLAAFDLVILSDSDEPPLYNLYMNYLYDTDDFENRELEDENIKFFVENEDGTWREFRDAGIVNTASGTASQGASSFYDLAKKMVRIVICTSGIDITKYGTVMNVQKNDFAVYSIEEKSPTATFKIQVQPTSNDVQLTIKRETETLKNTKLPKGATKLNGSKHIGWSITANTHTDMNGRIIYDMTKVSAKIDALLSANRRILAIQYDEEADSYFALETSYNGYVFYVELQMTTSQLKTNIYLVQFTGNSVVPSIAGKRFLIPPEELTKRTFTLSYYYNNTETSQPYLTLYVTNNESPFSAEISQLTIDNPTDVPLPTLDTANLLFVQLSLGRANEFKMTMTYQHSGNTYIDEAIDLSTLTIYRLQSDGKKWLKDSQSKSGSSVRQLLPRETVTDSSTWFAFVANPGEYDWRASSETKFVSKFVLALLACLAAFFYYGQLL